MQKCGIELAANQQKQIREIERFKNITISIKGTNAVEYEQSILMIHINGIWYPIGENCKLRTAHLRHAE